MSRRPNSRRGVAEAQLYGALQRAISLQRAGYTEELLEQRTILIERCATVEGCGGDPADVALRVWAREVNEDLAARLDPVDVFGVLA